MMPQTIRVIVGCAACHSRIFLWISIVGVPFVNVGRPVTANMIYPNEELKAVSYGSWAVRTELRGKRPQDLQHRTSRQRMVH